MPSNIDPSVPVQGNPTTQSVRDNFQAAGDEINALEAVDVGLASDITDLQAADVALDGRITVNEADIAAVEANTVTSGTGLTGGGAISTNPALALDTTYTDARYLSGNEPVTLTGDVTGSGSTTIATTVTEGAVTQHEAAINAGQVDGYSIKVDTGTPSGTDASTIYFVI